VNQTNNPYASPRASGKLAAPPANGLWGNRLAAAAFVLSLVFPFCALLGVVVLLWDNDFGVPYWRVHRLYRRALFNCSAISVGCLVLGLLALRRPPRKLALYGLLLGSLGTGYLLLALFNYVRR
jgi:hypothetical protein